MKKLLNKTSWLSIIPLLPITLALVPLFPLLFLNTGFYIDWENHFWTVGYFSEYIRQHGSVPVFINATQLSGMPQPVFYGYLFYPFLGTIALLLGPNLALRLSMFLLWCVQFFTVKKTVHFFGGDRNTSLFVACCFNWSTYALTNLYNRSALTEFFGTGFFVIAVCLLLIFLHQKTEKGLLKDGIAFGWVFCLCIGSHPITAMVGVPFLFILVVLALYKTPPFLMTQKKFMILSGVTLAAFIVVFPWIYAVLKFQKDLFLVRNFHSVIGYKDSIDSAFVRFFPLPLDIRSVEQGVMAVAAPYLEAQLAIPLLVFAFALVHSSGSFFEKTRSKNKTLLKVGVALFFLFTLLSLSPRLCNHLPSWFANVQFSYRLVTYANMSIFLMVLAGLSKPESLTKGVLSVRSFCWGLAFAGLCLKLVHSFPISHPMLVEKFTTLWHPRDYYGYKDYIVETWGPKVLHPDEKQPIPVFVIESPVPVGEGSHFGNLEPLTFTAKTVGLYQTSYSPFPWVSLELNGVPVKNEDMSFYKGRICVSIQKPGTYTLVIKPQPNPIWLGSRKVSFLLLVLWTCGVLFLGGFRNIPIRALRLSRSRA